MSVRTLNITAEPPTRAAFAPFGDVLAPRTDAKPVTNRDLLASGRARMSDPVPPERMAQWDILDYWPEIGTIARDPMKLGYVRCRAPKPWVFSWFERHLKGTQTMIPIGGGRCVVAVAPANAADDTTGLPDLSAVRAFVLDGNTALTIRPGTWHWTPFPLGAPCDFIYVVREQVVEDDLNFVDIEARLQTRIEIRLGDS
jgi:ureidoglycolate lyase